MTVAASPTADALGSGKAWSSGGTAAACFILVWLLDTYVPVFVAKPIPAEIVAALQVVLQPLAVYVTPHASGIRGAAAVGLLCVLAAGGLSACASDGTLTPGAQNAARIGCAVDGAWQPLGAAVLASLPETASLAAADAALHPAIVAACQAAGGVAGVR